MSTVIFKDILNHLIVLNNFLDKKALSDDDIDEEIKEYDDFLEALKELNELLVVYKSASLNDVRVGSKHIMRLYTLMNSVSSYMQNLHDRIIDVLKCYHKSTDRQIDMKPKKSAIVITKRPELSVEKIFKDVFNQLIILNNFLNKKALSGADVFEEEQSYNSFLQTIKNIGELLVICESTPIDNVQAGSDNIKKLHILMDELSWYIENLHEHVISVFRCYPVPDDL